MILATTTVEDFDRFMKVFSNEGAEKRKQHGSKGAMIFRDPKSGRPRAGGVRLGREGLGELRLRSDGSPDYERSRA